MDRGSREMMRMRWYAADRPLRDTQTHWILAPQHLPTLRLCSPQHQQRRTSLAVKHPSTNQREPGLFGNLRE